jgi:multimeric flavodoxin WrbA
MKITILNGDPNFKTSQFSKNIGDVVAKMGQKNAITTYNLAEMDLHFCTGCWSCWWKTPGLCAIKDDADIIFRSAMNCDLLVFASPLIAGFTSAELKKITDRLIVLLHPYIQLIDGECHHRKRYPKYPDLGVLLAKEPDTDEEDLSIVRDVYDRLAINFHSKVAMFMYLDDNLTPN